MAYQGQSPKVNRLRLQPRSSDPLNPQEGDMQYADGSVREEGVWVYKNSAWVKVGSDQSGLINYLTNGDAEAGNTSGWSLGNVTLTNKFPSGAPTFGSGASATLSFTNSSTSPLAGTRSFVLADSAATTAGNFVASDAFTIDSVDLAKVLTIDLSYQVTAGTINASGTSSNSLGIAIYDVTASAWIMPAGVWAITQTSGAGRAVATFQTPITSTQYRLVLYNANATSGAVTIKLDRLRVGPDSVSIGAPITDWTSYTPTFTGFGTVTTQSFQWRRVGSNVEIRGRFTVGTPTATEARMTLPAGLISASTISTLEIAGDAARNQGSSATFFRNIVLIEPSVAYLTFGKQESTSASLVKQNGTAVVTTGDIFAVNAILPIAGWSSQMQMSNDTDTRVVVSSATRVTNQTLTANVTDIVMTTSVLDTHAAYNTTTGAYIAPVSGYYRISGTIPLIGSYSAASIVAYVNGTSRATASIVINTSTFYLGVVVKLNAGDSLTLRSDSAIQITNRLSNVDIERISGPAVVAATETVAASYWVSANFAASTTVPINFDSKDFDSHNAVTTSATAWKFTAPVTATYQISGYASSSTGSGTVMIYKNGSASRPVASITPTAPGVSPGFSTSIRLNAGDYIDIRPSAAVTVTGNASQSNTAATNISIFKIGN
jgi:hypothetical protein